MQILALDLALTTGWALGSPSDSKPMSGSIQIVRQDASMAKLFCDWRIYLRDFLSLNPDVSLVVFESPLLPFMKQGNTSIQAIRRLIGMAAITEELLYSLDRYDIREARVSDVRSHFIGSNRHKRHEAKELTMRRCRSLGWAPKDDNAADALALWDYQCAMLRKNDLLRRAR